MRAAQFTAFKEPLEVVDLPTPAPPAGGVLIEVKAAGVCRSDWHAWQGHDDDIKSLPHILGHEFSGTIAALGEGVTGWKVGDRVTAPFACGCGDCDQCASGNAQVCPSQYQPGVTGPGAFAEFVVVPNVATNLVRLPPSVGFKEAASLGCRFATAYRALAHTDQANLQAGEHVAIFGCGGVGLSAVMIAKALGAEVIAIDVRDSVLAIAKNLGASQTYHFEDAADLSVDVAVDALGKTKTCLAAIRSLKPRGRHLQIGLMLDKDATPPIPIGDFIAKELRLIGSHGMSAKAYPDMLQLIADGRLQPSQLVTSSIALSQLPETMAAMANFDTAPGITIIDRFST